MARKKDDDKPSLGWSLFGAAAAAGAIAAVTYGAKKLYDYMEEEENKKAEEEKEKPKWDDEWYNKGVDERESGPSARALGYSCSSNNPPLSHPQDDTGQSSRKSVAVSRIVTLDRQLRSADLPLQDKLCSYYNGYVNISVDEMDRAKNVLRKVKQEILTFFQEKHPNLVTELKDCGSVAEDLKVIRPDEFDVMIPIQVSPQAFEIVPDGRVPGYYILRKNMKCDMYSSLDDFTVIDDEEYVDENGSQFVYVSPDKLRFKFQSYISKAVNGIHGDFKIKCGAKGPSIMLTVEYDRGKSFNVDFVPTVVLQEHQIVAKPHPEYLKKGNKAYDKYWRASFSHSEVNVLSRLSRDSCHRKCLKIAKSVRLNNHSQLGLFSSYVFKSVLLHMLDDSNDGLIEEAWQEDALQERFIDFFNTFLLYLRKGDLPHHFNPNINLLDEFSPVAVDNAKYYLAKLVAKNKFEDLLVTKY